MKEKTITDFAKWLWDMGKLKIETQIPPFETAEKLAEQYIKVMCLDENTDTDCCCERMEDKQIDIVNILESHSEVETTSGGEIIEFIDRNEFYKVANEITKLYPDPDINQRDFLNNK